MSLKNYYIFFVEIPPFVLLLKQSYSNSFINFKYLSKFAFATLLTKNSIHFIPHEKFDGIYIPYSYE